MTATDTKRMERIARESAVLARKSLKKRNERTAKRTEEGGNRFDLANLAGAVVEKAEIGFEHGARVRFCVCIDSCVEMRHANYVVG